MSRFSHRQQAANQVQFPEPSFISRKFLCVSQIAMTSFLCRNSAVIVGVYASPKSNPMDENESYFFSFTKSYFVSPNVSSWLSDFLIRLVGVINYVILSNCMATNGKPGTVCVFICQSGISCRRFNGFFFSSFLCIIT